MPYSDNKYMGTGLPYLQIYEIEGPEQPLAQDLFQYYSEKRENAGDLPAWRDFELPELVGRELAENVFVLEPVDDDWRYRLLGTDIVARFRIDRTGQKLRDFVDPEHAENLVQISNEIARTGEPKFFRLAPREPHLQHLLIETMSLPIRNNAGDEVWLFGGTFYGD